MNTLYRIIQIHIGIDKNNIFFPSGHCFDFWTNVRQSNPQLTLMQQLFYLYITSLHLSVVSPPDCFFKKFNKMKDLLDNIFLTDVHKEEILTIFSKIQKTYYALSKFLYIYKFKKAPIKIHDDLNMNPLSINQKNVFVLYQPDGKYLFSINDLMNIIRKNLTNAPYFFPEPLIPKNPYNNIKFTDVELYNIYFFIKFNHCIMPPLFHNLFLCNLDFRLFVENNECAIRELAIKNDVFSSHYSNLQDDVETMLNKYANYVVYRDKKVSVGLLIHEEFPKDKLVNIMKPYLYLYYLNLYSVSGTQKKYSSGLLLRKKMREFVKFNPMFGRKTIKILKQPYIRQPNVKGPRKKYTKVISFNEKHINFYNRGTVHYPSALNAFAEIINEPYSVIFDEEEKDDDSNDDDSNDEEEEETKDEEEEEEEETKDDEEEEKEEEKDDDTAVLSDSDADAEEDTDSIS